MYQPTDPASAATCLQQGSKDPSSMCETDRDSLEQQACTESALTRVSPVS